MFEKKLKNGFPVPVLGMGTWCFGGRESHNPENDDKAQIAALRAGLEAGIPLIDTAEHYAAGYAEILAGKAMEHFPREKIFLTGKVWKTHLDARGVVRAAEESLKRLKQEYFDLYLYHQVSEKIPLEETISAMNGLVRRGLVRAIGVSNFAKERLARAIRYSETPVSVNQVHYSLTVREAERTGLDSFCRDNDVILQAWRPVRGLTGNPLTDSLCEKYSCTLFQLAIAWLVRQENVVTLTAMKTEKHIPENLASLDIGLSKDDIELLRREMPGQLDRSPAVPLS